MIVHDFELELVRKRLADSGLVEGDDYNVVRRTKPMPTPELVEKVARALAIAHATDPDDSGPGTVQVTEIDGVTTMMPNHRGPLWKLWVTDVQAALKAHEDYLAERGLVVVPREPTSKMLNDGYRALRGNGSNASKPRPCYEAMISVAPQDSEKGE